MSLTLKVVEILDRLHIEKYFIEKDQEVYFRPLIIKINTNAIRQTFNKVCNVNGNAYIKNEFERKVLEELDF
jgi:hypothetical protein